MQEDFQSAPRASAQPSTREHQGKDARACQLPGNPDVEYFLSCELIKVVGVYFTIIFTSNCACAATFGSAKKCRIDGSDSIFQLVEVVIFLKSFFVHVCALVDFNHQRVSDIFNRSYRIRIRMVERN